MQAKNFNGFKHNFNVAIAFIEQLIRSILLNQKLPQVDDEFR